MIDKIIINNRKYKLGGWEADLQHIIYEKI